MIKKLVYVTAFLCVALLLLAGGANAWVVTPTATTPGRRQHTLSIASTVESDNNYSNAITSLQDYLQNNHALFWELFLARNTQEMWKRLSEKSSAGSTIFAVSDDDLTQALGNDRLEQLRDIRNEEVVERMAMYHVVDEKVTADLLFDSGGIVPLAGDSVPIERTIKGGLFGIGGEEDGSVTIGGRAKVVETTHLGDGNQIVHSVDNLISPSVLWRYCDQLRIPGSK